MESGKKELKHEETELRLGLPGTEGSEKQSQNCTTRIKKRAFCDINEEPTFGSSHLNTSGPQKAPVMGWPPIRSYRKNCFQAKKLEVEEGGQGIYVKVSMDGAPYLRKIDLKLYKGYPQLLEAVEDMFKFRVGKYSERGGYNGSEFAPTYEDKDGDWMMVGDVPWEMFMNSCKRLRIVKASEARGLGCSA